jgi:UDP-2-acetamido-2,6-beta-L-arabino-hexul-4-ose reductase
MIKVGITGQPGFMGTHLFNYLNIKEEIQMIPFEDLFFDNQVVLEKFVEQCDTIVHLAAMNRHEDQQVIYDTNIKLVKQLILACEATNSKPHILFSSSTQEERDNLYGKSKNDGRKLFEDWAKKNQTNFTGLIIPNVFGPFGRPYYNSVVATFCYQLTHGETPKIHMDGLVKLIYINDLIHEFYQAIISNNNQKIKSYIVKHTAEKKVSEILFLLEEYKTDYFENGIFPQLEDPFEKALFNTFRCYIPEKKFPMKLTKHIDDRGSFVEVVRAKTSGQYSYSTTKPGITRGNHFHTRKAERFIVISGKALIQLRKIGTDELIEYHLDGENPSFVDMPVWYTHNITNTGNEDLITLFWINEPYDQEDPDTFFETVYL